MKLIIIDHEPYRNYKRQHFYIDEFKNEGYEVQFWSVWRALDYSKKLQYNFEELDDDVIYFNNYLDILKELRKLPSITYICTEFWFNWSTFALTKYLNNDKFKVFSINHYHNLTSIFGKESKIKKIRSLTLNKIRNKLRNISYSYYSSIFNVNPLSLIFLTGNKTDESFANIKTESITYIDVEKLSEIKDSPRLMNKKYIVFLDTYIPSHPDAPRAGKKSISPDIYYSKMNKAFDKIEKQTNCEVIIAAHPKATYTDEFGGRLVLSGKTAELVLHSEMVLDSLSLSVNYAVQSMKKIYLVYTEEYLHDNDFLEEMYRGIKNVSILLNIEMINLDEDFHLSLNSNIDIEAYNTFEKEYLYAKKYPKTNFEIIKDAISNL